MFLEEFIFSSETIKVPRLTRKKNRKKEKHILHNPSIREKIKKKNSHYFSYTLYGYRKHILISLQKEQTLR